MYTHMRILYYPYYTHRDPWSQQTVPTPLTIGHEFSGVVEKVGSQVQGCVCVRACARACVGRIGVKAWGYRWGVCVCVDVCVLCVFVGGLLLDLSPPQHAHTQQSTHPSSHTHTHKNTYITHHIYAPLTSLY